MTLITSGSSAGGGSGTVNSGTGGQMAFYAGTGTAVSGDANFTISNGDATLGIAGSVVGSLTFSNVTSGGIKIASPSGALGTVTNTLQAVTDTVVYKATTDTLTNKTLTLASAHHSGPWQSDIGYIDEHNRYLQSALSAPTGNLSLTMGAEYINL